MESYLTGVWNVDKVGDFRRIFRYKFMLETVQDGGHSYYIKANKNSYALYRM